MCHSTLLQSLPWRRSLGWFWHFNIGVEDVDECAKRVRVLGGSVLVAPHDVPDVGRVCVVADPTGAVAHLMQPVEQ